MWLGKRHEVADSPSNDMAAAVEIAVTLLCGTEHLGDIAGNGGLFGNDSNDGQMSFYFSGRQE